MAVSWVDLNYVILFFILFPVCKFPQAEFEHSIPAFDITTLHFASLTVIVMMMMILMGPGDDTQYNPTNKFSYTIRVYGKKGILFAGTVCLRNT